MEKFIPSVTGEAYDWEGGRTRERERDGEREKTEGGKGREMERGKLARTQGEGGI